MNYPHKVMRRKYTKPRVVSRRVEFMTTTFGTGTPGGMVTPFGPHRKAPER
jgi:hypothetical protein